MKNGIVIVLSKPTDKNDDGMRMIPVETDSMLKTMYELIGCRMVEPFCLNDTTDLVCDEQGAYAGYDFGFRLDIVKKGYTQTLLGKCAITKNVNGEWTPFEDETEAIEFMYEYIKSITHIRCEKE